MEVISGVVTNLTGIVSNVLDIMVANPVMLIPVAAGVLGIGISVLRRLLP